MSRLTDTSDADSQGFVVIDRETVHRIQELYDAADECYKRPATVSVRQRLLAILEKLRRLLGDHEPDERQMLN